MVDERNQRIIPPLGNGGANRCLFMMGGYNLLGDLLEAESFSPYGS
jgi:hypothetical protein